ncbi:MAG: sigma-70 family RNA polymerase sigma factor [candidate division Zixibacteria bacterium]|nr:sigma-70 family RNA polymerase sigma factor [candidate division Zixibacteria bacterium]
MSRISDESGLANVVLDYYSGATHTVTSMYSDGIHGDSPAGTVIGMLGPCPEAEDVGQETFIRFYRAINEFRRQSSIASDITRISINPALDELKRRKRQCRLFAKGSEDISANIADHNDNEATFEKKQLIHKALQALSPEYRAVVVLRIMEGYSTEETAEILKLPIGTVTSRLYRAQIRLKEIVRPLLGECDG